MDLATFADADGEVKPIVSPPISPVKTNKKEKSDDGKKTPIEMAKQTMVNIGEKMEVDVLKVTEEERQAQFALIRASKDKTVTQLRELMVDMDPPPPLDHIVFRPVGDRWMNEQCNLLGLLRDKVGSRRDFVHIREQSNLLKVTDAPGRDNIVEIEGDGNSLFRALAWWITGDEYDHVKMREKIVSFMFNFPDEFGQKMMGEQGQKYTKESNNRMLNAGEWGTQCEIYGAATLLGVDIYTFSEGRWERYRPLIEWSAANGYKVSRVIGEEERTRYGLYLSNNNTMLYDVVFKNEPSGKRVRINEEVEQIPIHVPVPSESIQQQVRTMFTRSKINYEETKKRVEEVARDVSRLNDDQKEELFILFHSLIQEKNN